ncbi:MAG: hypothetical protein K2W82_17060 [Candidatus Obscuribacterales bacterium]|nr:hypothetical protein [Candidatus Obscuribacterales bacterium]
MIFQRLRIWADFKQRTGEGMGPIAAAVINLIAIVLGVLAGKESFVGGILGGLLGAIFFGFVAGIFCFGPFLYQVFYIDKPIEDRRRKQLERLKQAITDTWSLATRLNMCSHDQIKYRLQAAEAMLSEMPPFETDIGLWLDSAEENAKDGFRSLLRALELLKTVNEPNWEPDYPYIELDTENRFQLLFATFPSNTEQ